MLQFLRNSGNRFKFDSRNFSADLFREFASARGEKNLFPPVIFFGFFPDDQFPFFKIVEKNGYGLAENADFVRDDRRFRTFGRVQQQAEDEIGVQAQPPAFELTVVKRIRQTPEFGSFIEIFQRLAVGHFVFLQTRTSTAEQTE